MARKKSSSKGSVIYGIFITLYVIAGLCAIFYGLTLVWKYAEEYEASRPSKAIDAYIEKLNENFWDSSIADTVAEMDHEVQTDEDCREVIANILEGGVSYARTAGGDNSRKMVYNLKCDTGIFGKVTIVTDESKREESRFDMVPWIVESDEFYFDGLYSSVSVTVPESYSVQLNGVTLGEQYIVESGIHYDILEAYYTDYPNLPQKVTYKFDNIIGTLQPVILDAQGNVTTIDETKDDSQFIAQPDADTVATLSDFAARFEDRYRNYVSGAGNTLYQYDRLLTYIVKGSDLDQRMIKAQDGLDYAHTTSVKIDSTTVNSVIQIDSKTWIVDETTTVTAYGPKTETSTNEMQLIVVEKGVDDYRVVALTTIM